MKTPSFFSGIRTTDPQAAALSKPIEILPPPPQVVLPMPLHDGVPCRPGVKAGDYVTAGQKLAEVSGVPAVYTPIAGRVSAIGPRVHPSGESVLSVVVDNDLSDTVCPSVRPPADPDSLTVHQILLLIQNAGIGGTYSDSVPAAMKIASGLRRTDTVIISTCGSEPYVAADFRLLLEHPGDVLGGARVLAKIYGVDRVHIAVEAGQQEAVRLLRDKIREQKAPAVVDALQTQYPGGTQRPLSRAVTGRPQDAAKCAVFSAASAAAIYQAVYEGQPATHRVVTVSGSGVREPKNLLCPVGTPLRYLLDACGGVDPKTYKIILGGPMTGHVQYDMDAPVSWDTDAVLAFCGKEERSSAHPVCIRCGRCAAACPMGLQPFLLYRCCQAGTMERLAALSSCIACGACTYVCPGRVPLVQAFHAAKQKRALRKEDA